MVKKNSPKKSVNVDAVKREVKKAIQQHDSKPKKQTFTPGGFGEASPGTIRRESPLEQDMGTSRYREMIHDHNKKNEHILDRLPFTFPKKKVARSHRSLALPCPNCENEIFGSEHTVGAVCPKCKKYVRLTNPDAEELGYDPDINIGYRGTLSDKLAAKDKKKNSPA